MASLLEGTRNKVVNESMQSTPACEKESKKKIISYKKKPASSEVIYKRILYKENKEEKRVI